MDKKAGLTKAREALAAREALPYDEDGGEVPWDHLRAALAAVDELTAERDRLRARLALTERCAKVLADCPNSGHCLCESPEGQAAVSAYVEAADVAGAKS